MKWAGLLLAGGHSRRMGADKATLAVAAMPLWQRQMAKLRSAGAQPIWVAARPDQRWAQTLPERIDDDTADSGPLGGVVAGLRHARQAGCSHLAVLAVDLPALPLEWWAEISPNLAPDCGAIGRHEQRYEPLAAIYPVALWPTAAAALVEKRLSLQDLVATAVAAGLMSTVPIRPAQQAWFANWNTPADRDLPE